MTGWPDRRSDGTRVLITGAVFLAAIAYAIPFHRLGWFIQDEGVLYYQYYRVYQGQVPYRDFFTGYTPLSYYLHAGLFSLFGISITATRVWMAFVNATAAAGLYLVTRRLAGPIWALLPSAFFLAMEPGDIAVMMFHNSPYPSWYAITFSVWGTWALLRFLEASSRRARAIWLLLVGMLGGLSFLSKQNAGIFLLWGVSGFLAAEACRRTPASPPGGWPARLLRAAYLIVLPLAALLLVRTFLTPVTAALFVVPLAGLAVAAIRRPPGPLRALVAQWLWIGLGVLVVVAPFLVFFQVQMGLPAFAAAIFPTGAAVVRNLYVPFPSPDAVSIVLGIPLLLWVAGRCFAGGDGHGPTTRSGVLAKKLISFAGAGAPAVALVAGIAAQGGAIARALRGDYNLWEVYNTLSVGVDTLMAYGAPLVLVAGLVVVWRGDEDPLPGLRPGQASFRCVFWIAAAMMLLYYPRMDAAHLMGAVPLLYVVATGLLSRIYSTGESAPGAGWRVPRLAGAFCLLIAVGVVLMKSVPRVYSRVMLARSAQGLRLVATPREELGLARANLYFPTYYEGQNLRVQALADLVRYLRKHTAEGEPIFTFPGLPMLYFLADRPNPTRHDYFLGDNVSPREQLRLLATIERERVSTVILSGDAGDYFVKKGRDFTRLIRAYLRRRYSFVRRFGPYDVWKRVREGPDRADAGTGGGEFKTGSR